MFCFFKCFEFYQTSFHLRIISIKRCGLHVHVPQIDVLIKKICYVFAQISLHIIQENKDGYGSSKRKKRKEK